MNILQTPTSIKNVAFSVLAMCAIVFSMASCTKDDVAAAPTAEEPSSLRVGMHGYWTFDDNNPEVQGDSAWLLDDASLTGDRFGNSASALSLDGYKDMALTYTGKAIKVGGTSKYSVSVWVKPIKANGTIVCKGNYPDNAPLWSVELNKDNRFEAMRTVSPFRIESVDEARLDEWQHVVVTYDGRDLSIFVDGELQAQGPLGDVGQDREGASIDIGGHMGPWGPEDFFEGAIDDVRWYSRVLDEDEIDWLAKH